MRFGITPVQLEQLLADSLKPEEISGAPEVQHARVREVLRWFARPPHCAGNPKWRAGHAAELAYYIATGGKLQEIDLQALSQKHYLEGLRTTPEERSMLERLGALK